MYRKRKRPKYEMKIGKMTLGTTVTDEYRKIYAVTYIEYNPDNTIKEPIRGIPPKQIRDVIQKMNDMEKKGYKPMEAVEAPYRKKKKDSGE